MIENYTLIRLEPETELLPFDCENAELNGFFFDDAKKYLHERLASTYILHNNSVTIAYWNYLNDKIAYPDLNNDDKWHERIATFFSKRKSFKSYPAVKIGRLGVHKEFKGQRIGTAILDYTKALFIDNNRTGCAFITVDAFKESLAFYERNGFKFLSSRDRKSSTRLMYYNLGSMSD